MFIYLASPYWAESELVRLQRVKQVRIAAATLLMAGWPVYSPICHNAELSKCMPSDTAISHDFWMSIDLPILEAASYLWVLMLDGWEESKGVSREISFAKERNMDIFYLKPDLDEAVLGDLKYYYTHEQPFERIARSA